MNNPHIEERCYQIFFSLGGAIEQNYFAIFSRSNDDNGWSEWREVLVDNRVFNAKNMGQNGYIKFGQLLGKLIIQWGTVSSGFVTDSGGLGYKCAFAFPITFTTCFNLSILGNGGQPYNRERNYYRMESTLSDVQINTNHNGAFEYIVIGY